jgi:hypothetical protein
MSVVTLNTYRILESARRYPPETIRHGFHQLLELDPTLQQLVAASGGEAKVAEAVLLVLKEAIRENNADKKYWLEKLRDIKVISEALSDRLDALTDSSARFRDPYKCQSKKEPMSWLPLSSGMSTTHQPDR